MKVYTLWHQGDPGDPPWIVDAVDALTVHNNDFPAEYEKKRAMEEHRELIIFIPDSVLGELFDSPGVEVTVLPPEPR